MWCEGAYGTGLADVKQGSMYLSKSKSRMIGWKAILEARHGGKEKF